MTVMECGQSGAIRALCDQSFTWCSFMDAPVAPPPALVLLSMSLSHSCGLFFILLMVVAFLLRGRKSVSTLTQWDV